MVQAATTNSTYEPRQFQTVPLPEAVVLQPLPPTPDPEEANKAMHDLRAALDANVAEKRAEMTLHIEGLVQKEQVAAELCFASLYCIRVEILRHYSKMQDLCNESRSLLKPVPVEEVESNADIAHVIREIGASVDQLCCLEDSHREATKRLALSDSSRRVWTAIAFMYCGLKDMQVPLHVNEVVQQIDELAGDDTTVDRARLSIVLDELVKDVAAELHRAQEANSAFASWKQVLPAVITGANESLEQWSHESRPPVLVLPLSRLKNAAEASLADADAQLEKNLVALRALRNEAKVLEEAAASSSSATSRGTASSGVAAAVSVVVDAAQDIASQVSNFAVVGWSALSSRFHDFVNTDGSVSISVGLVDEKAFKVVVENQRYYPLRGWSTSLLPTDRPRYCTLAARECPAPGDTYVLSQLERWVDEWRPVDFGAADGWLYSGDFPARGYPKVSSLTMVRRRLFARPYVVVHNGRPSVLALGEGLKQDQELRSSDGHMQLIHQRDGNVVLYFATRPLWSTKTDHRQSGTFELLPDGNLVLFSPDRKPLWASGTADRGVKALVVTDEGRVELRTANGGIVWESTATSWCGATR